LRWFQSLSFPKSQSIYSLNVKRRGVRGEPTVQK
jgi:hypothetical protein